MSIQPSQSTPLVFTFPETAQHVRSVMIDGEPWFVAKDVTDILGLANGRDAVGRLPERMKSSVVIADGTPGNPNKTLIRESGVYRLIMRSNLPAAERFQDWLAEEVVPSLRTTGSYSITPAAPALPDMATPQGRMAVARMLLESTEREVELTTRVTELEPKALAHDTFMSAQAGDRLVRQAAKELGWKESDLRGFLLDEKLIYRRQRTCGGWEYDFYAAHGDCFNSVEKVVEHSWGRCAHYTLHVTPRGLSFVQMRISKRQAAMAAAIRSVPSQREAGAL
ncbi:BRO family protein [Streptomyces cyaneofuscatus]|uniref:BRO family protein n=1 Tax=Streptomyces cyaneofuscatus TaxID=66883 RepID=UPI0033BB5C88